MGLGETGPVVPLSSGATAIGAWNNLDIRRQRETIDLTLHNFIEPCCETLCVYDMLKDC